MKPIPLDRWGRQDMAKPTRKRKERRPQGPSPADQLLTIQRQLLNIAARGGAERVCRSFDETQLPFYRRRDGQEIEI
jgi:hypothetical protein